MQGYHLYDVLKQEDIFLSKIGICNECKRFDFKYQDLHQLIKGRTKQINGRFILSESKRDIFILVDYDTGKEYPCINITTLFLHLNYSPQKSGKQLRESVQLSHLRNKKNIFYTSLCNKLFYLKDKPPLSPPNLSTKHDSQKLKKLRNDNLLKNNVKRILRNRLRCALKQQLQKKENRTLDLLGCTVEELINHLEKQFKDEMTWKNHGKVWHVDHIRPCSSFDLFDVNQQRECFHYTNLQPLLIEENLKKNSWYNGVKY